MEKWWQLMNEKKEVLRELENCITGRFGIPMSLLDEWRPYMESKERITLGPKGIPQVDRVAAIGVSIARIESVIKPSTTFLQIFGDKATKNFVMLDKEKAIAFMKGDDIVLPSGEINASDGYVIVRYGKFQLGCGFLKGNELKNTLPKSRRVAGIKYL